MNQKKLQTVAELLSDDAGAGHGYAEAVRAILTTHPHYAPAYHRLLEIGEEMAAGDALAACERWHVAGQDMQQLLDEPEPAKRQLIIEVMSLEDRQAMVWRLLAEERAHRHRDVGRCLELAELAATIADGDLRHAGQGAGTDWAARGTRVQTTAAMAHWRTTSRSATRTADREHIVDRV